MRVNPAARSETMAPGHPVRGAMSVGGAIRALFRGACFLVIVLVAWCEYWLRILPRASGKRALQARWLHRWSVLICRLLQVELEVRGTPPHSGLVASNHLSYLDVFIFSAIAPCIFVAKQEIGKWPIFGRCARYAGTILLDRQRRAAVRPVAGEMRSALAAD